MKGGVFYSPFLSVKSVQSVAKRPGLHRARLFCKTSAAMRIKYLGLGLLAALLLPLGGGCKKSASDAEAKQKAESRNQKSPTLARVHWLGKDRIAAETNAARFLSLWNLPESARLEMQTLDKVAVLLAGEPQLVITNPVWMPGEPIPTNTPPPVSLLSGTNYLRATKRYPVATRLRPLLDDLVREECYLEIEQAAAAQPAELALAIRLAAPRAALWTSNLVAALGSLTNVQSLPPPANGLAWRFHPQVAADGSRRHLAGDKNAPTDVGGYTLSVNRVGDWTLVGLSPERSNAPTLNDLTARIQRTQTPVPPERSDATPWLEADLDLPRLSTALPALFPDSRFASDLSRFTFHVSGPPFHVSHLYFTAQADAAGVRTRAKLDFPEPLPLELEPWNIPTNLIHDPLIGFSALRGIRPWLTNLTSAFSLQPLAFPNQAFFWAQGGLPSLHFLAFPSADASNQVYQLSEMVLRDVNPILATNGWPGSAFERQTNAPGIKWLGYPDFSPSLDYADCGSNRFLIAGLAPNLMTNLPTPASLFQYLQASPKLVAYDWENTRTCVDGWTQMGQLTRHMLCLARMNTPYDAGLAWVAALSPHLTNSISSIELSSRTRLSFARSSSVGFTGVELHLLADWLESLQFPHGLHTFTAPAPPPPPPLDMPPVTNAPAPPK